MQSNTAEKTLKEITNTPNSRQPIPTTTNIAELAMMLASVTRLLNGVSYAFESTVSQHNNPQAALAWIQNHYETVAGAIHTAAALTDFVFTALDDNFV